MKAKIARPDGTTIEAEGTAEEILVLIAPPVVVKLSPAEPRKSLQEYFDQFQKQHPEQYPYPIYPTNPQITWKFGDTTYGDRTVPYQPAIDGPPLKIKSP